jgi:hypothetical protein
MVDIYVGPENTHWILHEKLLCTKSQFFNKIFYRGKKPSGHITANKTFGLPDEEDEPFRLFVGWLYSGRVAPPEQESDLGDLFDLYLMGEKWQIAGLIRDVLDAVRRFYLATDTFPGLRRVQYMYANTDEDSPMRQLLISSVARMLVLDVTIPAHWERALKKNGVLAVDLIRAVQQWRLDPRSIPDAREEAQKLEKEKVKEAEKAEAQQQGVPKIEQQNGDFDAVSSASQEVEKLADGIQSLSNGISGDHNG